MYRFPQLLSFSICIPIFWYLYNICYMCMVGQVFAFMQVDYLNHKLCECFHFIWYGANLDACPACKRKHQVQSGRYFSISFLSYVAIGLMAHPHLLYLNQYLSFLSFLISDENPWTPILSNAGPSLPSSSPSFPSSSSSWHPWALALSMWPGSAFLPPSPVLWPPLS